MFNYGDKVIVANKIDDGDFSYGNGMVGIVLSTVEDEKENLCFVIFQEKSNLPLMVYERELKLL